MNYFIYELFNSANGKIKYKTHFQYVHAALVKYNKLIEFIILQKFYNEKDVFAAEKYWIEYYKSNDRNFGYNLTSGVEGMAGRKLSESHISKLQMYNTNKKLSLITKNKISESIKQKKVFWTKKFKLFHYK